MRIIKLGIISLVFFAVFLTILSFLFPSHVRISKAIDIQTGKDTLLALLKNPVNWKKWYPGADTSSFFIADGKIKGLSTGKMKSLMITFVSDSAILTANAGSNSKKGKGGWNIFPGGTPNTFTVQWFMDFHFRWYPWEKFSGLLLEKRYGPMMEQGLDKLKKLLQ